MQQQIVVIWALKWGPFFMAIMYIALKAWDLFLSKKMRRKDRVGKDQSSVSSSNFLKVYINTLLYWKFQSRKPEKSPFNTNDLADFFFHLNLQHTQKNVLPPSFSHSEWRVKKEKKNLRFESAKKGKRKNWGNSFWEVKHNTKLNICEWRKKISTNTLRRLSSAKGSQIYAHTKRIKLKFFPSLKLKRTLTSEKGRFEGS